MEAITRQDGVSRTEEAVVRLSAYLGCLGLPVDCAEQHARTLIQRCVAQRGAADCDLIAATLPDLVSRFDAWLERLCEKAEGDSRCRPGLVAWSLALLLRGDPQAFLRQEDLPETFRLALSAAVQPAVPEPAPAPMPAQPLGQLPLVLRGGFWRGVAEELGGVALVLGAWMKRR